MALYKCSSTIIVKASYLSRTAEFSNTIDSCNALIYLRHFDWDMLTQSVNKIMTIL